NAIFYVDLGVVKKLRRWNESVQLPFAGAVLGVFEKVVEGSAIQVFSLEPHGLYPRSVMNVTEGIGGKKNKVGALAGSDNAEFFRSAEKLGGAISSGLQRGQRSEARLDEHRKLIVQAEAGKAIR